MTLLAEAPLPTSARLFAKVMLSVEPYVSDQHTQELVHFRSGLAADMVRLVPHGFCLMSRLRLRCWRGESMFRRPI